MTMWMVPPVAHTAYSPQHTAHSTRANRISTLRLHHHAPHLDTSARSHTPSSLVVLPTSIALRASLAHFFCPTRLATASGLPRPHPCTLAATDPTVLFPATVSPARCREARRCPTQVSTTQVSTSIVNDGHALTRPQLSTCTRNRMHVHTLKVWISQAEGRGNESMARRSKMHRLRMS